MYPVHYDEPEAPIEIVLYDPAWPIRFEEEAEVLQVRLAFFLISLAPCLPQSRVGFIPSLRLAQLDS